MYKVCQESVDGEREVIVFCGWPSSNALFHLNLPGILISLDWYTSTEVDASRSIFEMLVDCDTWKRVLSYREAMQKFGHQESRLSRSASSFYHHLELPRKFSHTQSFTSTCMSIITRALGVAPSPPLALLPPPSSRSNLLQLTIHLFSPPITV